MLPIPTYSNVTVCLMVRGNPKENQYHAPDVVDIIIKSPHKI